MNFNSVARKTWTITFGLIIITFIATTTFYGYFYKKQVENNYLNDFSELILNVENLSDNNPEILTETLAEYNTLNSRVYFSVRSVKEEIPSIAEHKIAFPPYIQQHLEQESDIVEAVSHGEDTQVQNRATTEDEKGTLYIFRVKNFEVDGSPAVLYSYTDLSFLKTLEGRMIPVVTWLVLVYAFLAFIYYQYLRRTLSEPITSMTNIAFQYAQNEFNNRLEITGRDDLSQLATAMNKMGYSLETKGTAVKQEKELLSKILSVIDTGVLFFDSDHTLLLSNPSGNIFYTNYLEHGKTLSMTEIDTFSAAINDSIENVKSTQMTLELANHFFDVMISPLTEQNNEVIRGYVISSNDRTNEHRLDKMREDFISNVSHEIRTPLVMVQGYSEAIIDGVAESHEDMIEMAAIIRDESKRMNRMVNEMLDLSRMEAGFIELNKEKIKSIPYFKRLLSRFKKMADNENVHLEVEIEPEISEIYADKDKMDQVFFNLINNAIRHTSMANREEPMVKLWIHLDKIVDQILIEVIDNGTGIPEEDIPYIFERFYKADKSRKNVQKNKMGTGIGLSLVKEIVEAHDGRVIVKSELGVGTSFIVSIPYVDLASIDDYK